MNRIVPVLAVAAAALLVSLPPASAAGTYDGTWVIDAPAAGGEGGGSTGSEAGCSAIQFELRVADNKISGNLRRSATGTGTQVTGAPAGKGTPLTGTVDADGTMAATWESYKITGKFSGNKVEVHWKGQCGPRTGTGKKEAS